MKIINANTIDSNININLILSLALFAIAFGLPQLPRNVFDERFRTSERGIPFRILRSEVSPINGANFRFPFRDGTFGEVRYVADENGYRPESALIPTPHPLPAHAIEQIRVAAEQRARGINWEDPNYRI
ncbi:hypothetical protein Anas_09111 [Armadillidium nasatum]|uniref:Cuticle protein n=1 Tax=Armadillidium nasatum TaxID=96803 RepID=A0A5N5SVS2_9CRUS|nr:hypothetical protein Anas_09111 [Armadillidium nasatum]